ncbi:hypothetical protein HMPREF9078_00767 [Capnocytophaga sp. oral taxon 380 str. F0488]|nr:hypothetical protein HMPREF9078_00767 [Capnocytophaga sp. oral taxon 380 str. F0488]
MQRYENNHKCQYIYASHINFYTILFQFTAFTVSILLLFRLYILSFFQSSSFA